jgi:hypothetical protein
VHGKRKTRAWGREAATGVARGAGDAWDRTERGLDQSQWRGREARAEEGNGRGPGLLIPCRELGNTAHSIWWGWGLTFIYIAAKSAYEGFFIGAVQFRPWERIWKSWAPGKCKFFMWLVAHNRCWTADRLAKRGLPHPECCPLCDQAEETIEYLLISCVFSRQVWYNILHKVGLQYLSP